MEQPHAGTACWDITVAGIRNDFDFFLVENMLEKPVIKCDKRFFLEGGLWGGNTNTTY